MRRLKAEKDGPSGLASWDLSAFRYPRSAEKLKKTESREKIRHLQLHFADEHGKLAHVSKGSFRLTFLAQKKLFSWTSSSPWKM